MPKTISRDDFATLMADAAMKLPMTRSRKKTDPVGEFVDTFDYDAMSNEWANAVQWVRGVGDDGTKMTPVPTGGFKAIPMRTLDDLPPHIAAVVAEAKAHLGVEKILEPVY